MGTILDVLSFAGNCPVWIEVLKILVRGLQMISLDNLRMLTGHQYSPYDLLFGVSIISVRISFSDTGVKKKEFSILSDFR